MQDQHPEQLTLGHCPLCKDSCVWRQIQDLFCLMSICPIREMGMHCVAMRCPKASHTFLFLTGLNRIVALTLGVSALSLELEED